MLKVMKGWNLRKKDIVFQPFIAIIFIKKKKSCVFAFHSYSKMLEETTKKSDFLK